MVAAVIYALWLTDADGTPIDFGPPYYPSSYVGQLLPPSSDTFEEAVAIAMSDDLPIPYVQIMDPDTTPMEFLPFLAAHRSVDLWYNDWSEARKRQMVSEAEELAGLKGTHEGIVRFLGYVDAEVLDWVDYPSRFVLGRSSPSFAPLNHPAFKKRWLVKVLLKKPVNAFVIGRSGLGQGGLRPVDLEPIRRAKHAMLVAKAPETEYLVSFAWRRPLTFGDGATFADAPHFGAYVDRDRL
jgi:phage tail P2-like protein